MLKQARIVDEDRDSSESFASLLESTTDERFVSDVAGDRDRASGAMLRIDFAGYLRQLLARSADQHNFGSAIRK